MKPDVKADSISYVLSRTREAPAVSREEFAQALSEYGAGGDAVQRLISANTRLCSYIVQMICPHGGLKDDLFSAALKGLTDAAHSYDPAKGLFSAWAGCYIRNEIYQTLSSIGHPVSTPIRLIKTRRKIAAARAELLALGQEPTIAQIAEKAGCREGTVAAVQFLDGPTLALDREPSHEGYSGDCAGLEGAGMSPAGDALLADDHSALYAALDNCLDEAERVVITRYYGLDGDPSESLAEIGGRLGLSRQRLCQIVNGSRLKLKRGLAELSGPSIFGPM